MSGFSERGYLSLSGGEKQRVILARAIAQNTETMILDEPTNHLDIKHQLFLLDYLKNSGKTVLTVLHDLRLAAHYCDRIYLLLDGNIVAEGKPVDVLTTENIQRVFGINGKAIVMPDGQTDFQMF